MTLTLVLILRGVISPRDPNINKGNTHMKNQLFGVFMKNNLTSPLSLRILAVLVAVPKLETAAIWGRVCKMKGSDVPIGSVSTALSRLGSKGLVRSVSRKPKGGGRPKAIYSTTKAGKSVLSNYRDSVAMPSTPRDGNAKSLTTQAVVTATACNTA